MFMTIKAAKHMVLGRIRDKVYIDAARNLAYTSISKCSNKEK